MTRSVVASEPRIHSRTKVKTGCATCRIRRVKCDEKKPSCQRCVSTGRTCDGYNSPFRNSTSQSIKFVHNDINSDIGLESVQPSLDETTPQEIDLLNRYFSTKTIFNVDLDCDEEARQVLQASLTDSSIHHAVSSLRALRENLETAGNDPTSVSYSHGLQQYSMALGGLVSKLSSSGSQGLKSALLCCQIFISIEQVQGNYGAMAQHIIRGLRIMYEYHARPHLVTPDELVPAYHNQLPLLDVFIIKLFIAPCKFAEPPARSDKSATASPEHEISPQPQPIEPHYLRVIAPDKRTELTKIASSTLKFLIKVSQVESVANVLQLLPEKAALLASLESWLHDLEHIHNDAVLLDREPISVAFLRLFYLILKIVLWGALESSPDIDVNMRTESDKLQNLADKLSERLRDYEMPSGVALG